MLEQQVTQEPRRLPDDSRIYLTYTGLETDLIFNRGIDLPEFASFPLLEHADGRALLAAAFQDQIAVARAGGCGCILESTTWVANRDRAAPLGYGADQLAEVNRRSMAFLAEQRDAAGYDPILLSANVGPRADAFSPEVTMTADEARAYHAEQIGWLAETEVDFIAGYTLANVPEAIGLAQAATDHHLSVAISFTVEVDGRLPSGTPFPEALAETDATTGGAVAYYMINCAHPDHIARAFGDADAHWSPRLQGLVVNASRCSHAELDEATELDAGDPPELGRAVAALTRAHTQLKVIGGCCGTDMRHLREIVRNLSPD
ncbi:homocysteine S-methyltransferase family protein [Oceanomicrobium pacificus]|uniref:Homocysteine S-methyltransferase n=1 Tax=Oceanomicrobium pacificus TaxID=2692916 RepID=A0A6B0TTA7_9RHOB|nr:homocysteine S-methyltransferase family protein [Oceanomicrobium pacificus]MXU66009.1 homocysteine S-methyltransferase [Oceanomicrobium pacificus]